MLGSCDPSRSGGRRLSLRPASSCGVAGDQIWSHEAPDLRARRHDVDHCHVTKVRIVGRALMLEPDLLFFDEPSLVACQLHRPTTAPSRTLEPQLLDPQLAEQAGPVTKVPSATSIRLLATESRGSIGRHVLHRQSDGELIEDPIWDGPLLRTGISIPALRVEVASSPKLRPVDACDVPAIAANLLAWNLESSGGTCLVGAVEFETIGTDRVVRTQIVRGSEPVSGELPGDLAAVAGRLLRRLAVDGLSPMLKER